MEQLASNTPPQHTPGPWMEYGESGDWWIAGGNPDIPEEHYVICDSLDIKEADVALICAAPELLATLQEAHKDVCSLHCPSVWETGQEQPHTKRCIAIRELLKKAGVE